MTSPLFGPEPTERDHPYYINLRKGSFRPDIKDWCDQAYAKATPLLDKNFCQEFRLSTPHRFSELFFAMAFLEAGWEPVERVKGFDLAFKVGEGRLLVEITTPDPPSSETWHSEVKDGVSLWSADESSWDASLLRLTGGFKSKADNIRKLIADGVVKDQDYVVIALSGFRLSQETPTAPEDGGDLPDFVKAFLPIGSRYVTIRIGEGAENQPTEGGYLYKGTIERDGKSPVPRDFFLQADFRHIDAVAYTALHVGGPGDGPPRPGKQCGVLHNPMSKKKLVKVGIGNENTVKIEDDRFTLEPI
jgi:hypothetical protein